MISARDQEAETKARATVANRMKNCIRATGRRYGGWGVGGLNVMVGSKSRCWTILFCPPGSDRLVHKGWESPSEELAAQRAHSTPIRTKSLVPLKRVRLRVTTTVSTPSAGSPGVWIAPTSSVQVNKSVELHTV